MRTIKIRVRNREKDTLIKIVRLEPIKKTLLVQESELKLKNHGIHCDH